MADTRAVIREETLTFTVAKNETFDERSATVELKGADGKVLQSISFKQKEYGGTIDVDEEYVVDAEGGELEVKLSTDIDFTTSIPEEAKSWISIIETRSMRSEGLTFDIAINDDVNERSATINLQNAKGNDAGPYPTQNHTDPSWMDIICGNVLVFFLNIAERTVPYEQENQRAEDKGASLALLLLYSRRYLPPVVAYIPPLPHF